MTFHVALTGKDKYFEWLAVAVRDGKQRKQGGYKSAEKMIHEQRVTGHTPFVESKNMPSAARPDLSWRQEGCFMAGARFVGRQSSG